MATAGTTAGLLLWWQVFATVPAESNALPFTVLVLLLGLATIVTDRLTRPFVGTASTAASTTAATALAYLLSTTPRGQGLAVLLDLLYLLPYVAVSAAAVAGAVSGLYLLHRRLPRLQRAWATGVVLLGASAWAGWLSWWILAEPSPAGSNWLLAGAAGSLLLATAVGEVKVGRWQGVVFALCPALLLAAGPLAASDPLGVIAWFILSAMAGAGCLLVVGAVAAARSARRHLPAAAR